MGKTVLKAGGIVVRRMDGGPRVLLVTARKGKRWIFPKGNVEHGEKTAAAALREAREEGNVVGRLAGRSGVAAYSSGGRRNRVEYFLIAYTRDCDEGGEERECRWCSIRQATRMLAHPHARRILLESRERIVALAAKKRS